MITPKPDIQFVLNVERGVLEKQAMLACASIRTLGGALAHSQITVVSPRAARRPCRETLHRLASMDVDYLPLELASPIAANGPTYKALASAYVESRPGPPILVQLDSDSLFVAEPIALLTVGAAAGRPVDGKSISTTGADDATDPFWRDACRMVGVDYDRIPFLQTTLTDLRIKANYNGGLLAARRDQALFQRTAAIMVRIASSGLRPPDRNGMTIQTGSETVTDAGAVFFGLDQVAFSLATTAAGVAVDLLPPTYNYPLHMAAQHRAMIPHPLVHLHYHWLGTTPDGPDNVLLNESLPVSETATRLLRAWLPFGETEPLA